MNITIKMDYVKTIEEEINEVVALYSDIDMGLKSVKLVEMLTSFKENLVFSRGMVNIAMNTVVVSISDEFLMGFFKLYCKHTKDLHPIMLMVEKIIDVAKPVATSMTADYRSFYDKW